MSKGTSDRYQDKHLEDIGWARMKIILDKEMPQKKRRFLWLPLYGGIAASFAVVAVSMYLLMSTGNESTTQLTAMHQTENASEPVNPSVDGATLSAEEMVVTNKESAARDQKKMIAANIVTENEQPFVSALNTEIKAGRKDSKADVKKDIATASTPDVDHRQGESLDKKVISEDVPEEETRGDHITDSKLIEREQRTATYFALLPHLSSVPSYDDEMSIRIYRDTFTSRASEVIETKNRKFSVELGVSALSDLPLQTFSWDGGLNFRYRFSRKIGIATGLFFWRISSRRSFYVNQYAANTQADRANAWFLGLNSSQVDTLRLAGSTKKLNYIRLPLKIQFLPENRLSPSIGISRIWYAQGLQSFEEQLTADVNTPSPTTGGSLSVAAPEIVRKNNWTVDLGVTWKITDHFLTDLSISRGLKSYVNYDVQGSDFSELHNHYRLSMFYRF